MAFKVAMIVRAPEANPEKDISTLVTKNIEVTTIAVELQNSEQTVKVCEELARDYGIHAIVLCPAVSNELVADITKAIGSGVALFVARGDFQSTFLASESIEREWFS